MKVRKKEENRKKRQTRITNYWKKETRRGSKTENKRRKWKENKKARKQKEKESEKKEKSMKGKNKEARND